VRRRAQLPCGIFRRVADLLDAENRAHLEKDVFVPIGGPENESAQLNYSSREPGRTSRERGHSQISRAVGTGGVVVEQGDRRGTAERGLYTAAEEKFVSDRERRTLFDPWKALQRGVN